MQYALYQPTQVMEVSGSGAVTALEPGWNYVIASSKNTMFDSNMCLITVVDTLPAQSVSVSLAAGSAGILSENVLTIEAGSTAQLEAAVEPYNSTSTLSWSGGNDCASVDDNGKITAIKKGSARVTASAGEKSAAITVRVLERHAAVESTCTENGTIEYWEDADGNLYDSNEGITPVDDISLPLAAHTLSKVSAVPAECETDGIAEHYKCSVCGALYADADGKKPTTAEAVVTAAPGHDWNRGELTKKPAKKESGEITYTCSRDGSHTYTHEVPAGTDYIKVPDSQYKLGSNKDITFTITCDDEDTDEFLVEFFEGLWLDGKELTAGKDYKYSKGSVNVTLKSSYIEKNITSRGKYKLKAVFSSGTATGTLKVVSGSSGTPGTGDDTSIPAMVGAALSLLTSLVYIAYSIYSSRKIAGEQER